MDQERQFLNNVSGGVFLSIRNIINIQSYLYKNTLIEKDDSLIKLEKAGEGNMNCVLRATTNKGTFIIKQSRSWVEKYPQIAAPINRIKIEAEYFNQIKSNSTLERFSPEIRFFDSENYLMIMEDLGNTQDLSFLYQESKSLNLTDLDHMLDYIEQLHSIPIDSFPSNLDMKQLNHEHIFVIPFQESNGLGLNEIQNGLKDVAGLIYSDDLKKRVADLGKEYLANGDTLLHGDYYLGSVLNTPNGLKVIDAEFAFLGFPEFDWAVLFAHLYMANQSEEVINRMEKRIDKKIQLDKTKILAFAGIEILRRLFGIAQLPLTLNISQKEKLTITAIGWILV